MGWSGDRCPSWILSRSYRASRGRTSQEEGTSMARVYIGSIGRFLNSAREMSSSLVGK